jgi:hypothetical protein
MRADLHHQGFLTLPVISSSILDFPRFFVMINLFRVRFMGGYVGKAGRQISSPLKRNWGKCGADPAADCSSELSPISDL